MIRNRWEKGNLFYWYWNSLSIRPIHSSFPKIKIFFDSFQFQKNLHEKKFAWMICIMGCGGYVLSCFKDKVGKIDHFGSIWAAGRLDVLVLIIEYTLQYYD